MKTAIRRLTALSAGCLMAAALALPASATPIRASQDGVASSSVVLAQYNRNRHGGHFYMRHGNPYYGGHRGYRHYRRGYRHYNGYWFPPSAFIAGAIIGGAMGGARHQMSRSHVRWCERHYRSYDVRTDTYQPYHGPRRRCVSPY